MQYEVMNRLAARQATYQQNAPITAIISITDIGDELNKFYPQEWLSDVLELQFNDVDYGKGCITEKHAKSIAEFVKKNYLLVERFIIHCEYGKSRSAGVAAAISDYFEGHDNGIYRNNAYSPNSVCYRAVLSALRSGV